MSDTKVAKMNLGKNLNEKLDYTMVCSFREYEPGTTLHETDKDTWQLLK